MTLSPRLAEGRSPTRSSSQVSASIPILASTPSRFGGGGRHSNDYQGGDRRSGNEDFLLSFVDVPFTFGQDIDVTLQLLIVAAATPLAGIIGLIDHGVSYAGADYAHTMTWQGLIDVRDATGASITNYSAVSADSGFNFRAGPQQVPEPATLVLFSLGMFGLVIARTRRAIRPRLI